MFRSTIKRGGSSSNGILKTPSCLSICSSSSKKNQIFFSTSRFAHSDAIETLISDHRKVSHLLEKLLQTGKEDLEGQEAKKDFNRVLKTEEKKLRDKPPHVTSPTGSDTAASDPWSTPSGDLFSTSESATDNQMVEKRKILETVINELSIHSHIEEMHMYPVIRQSIQNGNSLIDRSLNEHQEVKEILFDLDKFSGSLGTDPSTWPAFPTDKIERLRSSLMQHIKEEEEEIFPEVKKCLSQDRLNELGDTLDSARSTVPSRPHPSAPNQPPLMNMAGPMAAVMDKGKDAIRELKEKMTASH